ncbi:hypothetical protein POTOM_042708 [Populus tomentosa]|uniref:Uncharacterized protein n=1 Tax=Populus tomentosa TaxID=118781 RepID=A0A8X8CG06_POPTO|nr:hypothetical protein POTOM_042708 [Populus tomentosa]
MSSGDQMIAMDPTIAKARLSSLLLPAPAGNRTRGSVPWQGTILPLDHWCLLTLIPRDYIKNSHMSSVNQMIAMDPTIAKARLSSLLFSAPAGNRTRVCTVAGYYSTTRPLVLVDSFLHLIA